MVVMTVRPQRHELLRDEEQQAGAPWLTRSLTSGNDMQIAAHRSSTLRRTTAAPYRHGGPSSAGVVEESLDRGQRGEQLLELLRIEQRDPLPRATRPCGDGSARAASSPASVMVTSTSRRSERSWALVTRPASMSAFTLRVTPGADSRSRGREVRQRDRAESVDRRQRRELGRRERSRRRAPPGAAPRARPSRRIGWAATALRSTALVLVVTDDRSPLRAETTAALVMSVLLLRSCALTGHDDEAPGFPWPVSLGQPVHGTTFTGAVGASNW